MRAYNTILDEAEREVAKYPGASVRMDCAKKHRVLIIRYGGQTRKVFTSVSPSDHRALRNVVADVRRALRDLGALAEGS